MPYTKVDDINIYYAIFSDTPDDLSQKPTLVFLHGGVGIADHTLYVPFWSQLSNQVNVVFIDQRGCGKSDKGEPEKWNLNQHGKDVYLFCESLNISKPIVAGVSWGGYVAISYSIQYPNHPGALILCNTEAKVSQEERYKAFLRIGGQEAAAAVKAFDTNWNSLMNENYFKYCLPFFAKNAYTKEELAGCIRNPDIWKKYMEEEHGKFNFTKELSKIQCPVLHLAGENDPVHPVSCAEETARHIGKLCEFVIIKNTGDPVYRDQPEETLNIISNFITKTLCNP
jgi:pimeloyl-ACP methyl ester carboxylesterase